MIYNLPGSCYPQNLAFGGIELHLPSFPPVFDPVQVILEASCVFFRSDCQVKERVVSKKTDFGGKCGGKIINEIEEETWA